MNKPTENGWYWAREHDNSSWEPTFVVSVAGTLVWLCPGEDGSRDLSEIHQWGPLCHPPQEVFAGFL